MNYWKSGLLVTTVAVIIGVAIWYTQFREVPATPDNTPLATLPQSEPAPAPAPAGPKYPLPAAETPATAVAADATPPVPDSEDTFREAARQLVGGVPFESLLIPDALIRRIVVTVDNLPRDRIPVSLRPFKRVPGDFAVLPQGDGFIVNPINDARYAPLVQLFTNTETSLLVKLYLRYYPLFQQAYRELGYPDGYFNDRVVAAIDDLLSTPDIDPPITLVRPKVYYEFADPQLEAASAGQKLMLRMSAADRATVKTKLASIRAQLVNKGGANKSALP
jgi:hypothetical protein